MKIYLAGIDGKREREIVDRVGIRHLLVSYFFPSQRRIFLDNEFIKGKDIILDSGAYSAFTRKLTIDIGNYIAFIKKYKVRKYIALDVIGDKQSTERNLEVMKFAGLKPIPVYHFQTNDLDLFAQLCTSYETVCIGGSAGIRGKVTLAHQLVEIIDKIKPKAKIHLLGFSSTRAFPIIKNHIYSVDSTTWAVAAGFGEIITPLGKRVKWFGTKRERLEINAKHFKNLEKGL